MDIVFPLLCYSNEDDQLWHDDPYEYIRMKFGKYKNNKYIHVCTCTVYINCMCYIVLPQIKVKKF